eukprot:gene10695-7428_t
MDLRKSEKVSVFIEAIKSIFIREGGKFKLHKRKAKRGRHQSHMR